MLIQQTLIQYLLQKKNLCDIFKVLTIWGNINLFIRPQHHPVQLPVPDSGEGSHSACGGGDHAGDKRSADQKDMPDVWDLSAVQV